jgi:hypothetical protein
MDYPTGKWYLSGPMSGIYGFNIPLFDSVSARLRAEGYEIVSPAELDSQDFRDRCLASDGKSIPAGGDTWGTLLARDVRVLADDGITGVILLPHWERSRGARLETFVALLNGLQFREWVGVQQRSYPIEVDRVREIIRRNMP